MFRWFRRFMVFRTKPSKLPKPSKQKLISVYYNKSYYIFQRQIQVNKILWRPA